MSRGLPGGRAASTALHSCSFAPLARCESWAGQAPFGGLGQTCGQDSGWPLELRWWEGLREGGPGECPEPWVPVRLGQHRPILKGAGGRPELRGTETGRGVVGVRCPGGLPAAPTRPCVPPPPPPPASPSCLASSPCPGALPALLGPGPGVWGSPPQPRPTAGRNRPPVSALPGLGRVAARCLRAASLRRVAAASWLQTSRTCFCRSGEDSEALSQNPCPGAALGPRLWEQLQEGPRPTTPWLCDLEQVARPL